MGLHQRVRPGRRPPAHRARDHGLDRARPADRTRVACAALVACDLLRNCIRRARSARAPTTEFATGRGWRSGGVDLARDRAGRLVGSPASKRCGPAAAYGHFAAALQGIVDRVVQFIEDVPRQRSVDYRAHEVAIADGCAAIEREAHGLSLAALDVDAPRLRINPSWPGDGGAHALPPEWWYLADRCRDVVRATIQVVLDEELQRRIGAGPYERSDDRIDVRNGQYPRRVVTTSGEVDVRVGRSRNGDSATAPLGRYARRRPEIDEAWNFRCRSRARRSGHRAERVRTRSVRRQSPGC